LIRKKNKELKNVINKWKIYANFLIAEFQSADTEIIDDEEFQYLKQMKEIKDVYKVAFDNMKSYKAEVEHLTKLVDRCREKLLSDFDNW
jgi:kinesin family protein 6/9